MLETISFAHKLPPVLTIVRAKVATSNIVASAIWCGHLLHLLETEAANIAGNNRFTKLAKDDQK